MEKISQAITELEAASVVAKGLTADLTKTRKLLTAMIDAPDGLKPHSAWYLTSVRNGVDEWIQHINRGVFHLNGDLETLRRLPEAEAS